MEGTPRDVGDGLPNLLGVVLARCSALQVITFTKVYFALRVPAAQVLSLVTTTTLPPLTGPSRRGCA